MSLAFNSKSNKFQSLNNFKINLNLLSIFSKLKVLLNVLKFVCLWFLVANFLHNSKCLSVRIVWGRVIFSSAKDKRLIFHVKVP